MDSLSNTEVATAEVRCKFDPDRMQQMLCKIHGFGETLKTVYSTSPWSTLGFGGFDGMVPEEGTEILVVRPSGSSEWYMLSCVNSKEPSITGDANEMTVKIAPPNRNMGDVNGGMTGAGTGGTDKIQLQHQLGQGWEIANQRRPDAMNVKSELYTGVGKKVSCIDSPAEDQILVDTGSHFGTCRFSMTNQPKSDIVAHHQFKLDTTGPQKLFNHESQTDILVWDGRELQFLNYSKGTNAPPGPGPQMNYWGNVNMQSSYNDINIFTTQKRDEERPEGKDGRIFIECLSTDGKDQIIQIQTRGQNSEGNAVDEEKCVIRISSGGKVEIKTGPDFNLDIDCGGEINMKAEKSINITAGEEINLKSVENINLDGEKIYLNSGHATAANPQIGETEGHYKGEGIHTYGGTSALGPIAPG